MFTGIIRVALLAAIAQCALSFTSPLHAASLSLRKDLPMSGAARSRHASVVMKAHDDKLPPISRRLIASLLFSASVGVPKALAMTDEEEFLKLQAEAQRIQGVINTQKAAFEGTPGLASAKPITAKKDETVASAGASAPNPYMGPHDVIKTLMTALKQNDPNSNSGLKTVLDFTAPTNPILQNTQYFERQMVNSKYSVLLGHFDDFSIMKTDNYKDGETGQPVALVGMKVFASYKTLLTCGVQFEDIEYDGESEQAAVKVNWQLSKDPKTGCWLSDTMYFAKPQE